MAAIPVMKNRKKVLKDITIRCRPEDSTHPILGALTLGIWGRDDQDNVKLERVSATTWKCSRRIELKRGMGKIMFVMLAKPDEGLGYLTFRGDDIKALIAATEDIERNIEPGGPTCVSLWIKFTVVSNGRTVVKSAGLPGGVDMFLTSDRSKDLRLLKSFGDQFLFKKDLDNAISAYELAIGMSTDHEKHGEYIEVAVLPRVIRFHVSKNIRDINRAISLLEIAVSVTPEGHASLPGRFEYLGNSFTSRFEGTGDLADIDGAISNFQRAIELTPPGRADLPSMLNNLGASFGSRFGRTRNVADIESAISNHQRAVELTPPNHADLPSRLNNLGNSFQSRFERTGDLADIDSAIFNQQRAVELTPPGHDDLRSWTNNLGISFWSRFRHTGDLADIGSAISNKQRAIKLTPPDHDDLPSELNNLGNSFQSRFELTGNLADIESAISNHQRAIKLTPPGHVDLPSHLNNLGNSFDCRFVQTGDLADIESAICNQQRAVELTSLDHAELPSYLQNLGKSFQSRFERTGDLVDIESAISNNQRAVELTPPGHAHLPSYLNSLGVSFWSRFGRTNDLADIESAVSNKQRSVELTPPGHADLPSRLNNLGTSFWSRFGRTGDLADIDSAISNQQHAVKLTLPLHADLPSHLNNLGASFASRFRLTGDFADLGSSILNFQRAVKLTPPGHALLPSRLNNLGQSLDSRFVRTGDLADIESAISNQQLAVKLTPPGHANLSSLLKNLGNFFESRFKCTKNSEDFDQAISNYRLSATQSTGPPSKRLHGAKSWATLSHLSGRSDALKAFGVAIELLSLVAGLEQTVHKRHSNLVDKSNLTMFAAATAINAGQLGTALEWLEQGRCLVWNQIQHLRTPVDDLRACDPTLADRFVKVGNALEASGSRGETSNIFSEKTMAKAIDVQRESERHVELANEWAKLLEKIRALPNFRDFLLPPKAASLLSGLPHDGAVVIFNIHEEQCDALGLVSGAEILHIPLPNFNMEKAIKLRDSLYTYLTTQHARARNAERGMKFRLPPSGKIHNVLQILWTHVVKPVLDALEYNSTHNSSRPRIWWCPTGPLAFLPIHAAGIYASDKSHAGPCVSDSIISSFVPTISSLVQRMKSVLHSSNGTPTRLLLVSQPSTPGLLRIQAARTETAELQELMEKENLESSLIKDEVATIARVKAEMASCSWVHFACHGIQAPEPLQSGLHIHDGRLELLEMMKQRIEYTEHAFLSACQTGQGDEKLPDEVVHLAAGMLAVGYYGVIGTLWSISDKHGPEIAECFYRHILDARLKVGERRLDSTRAAYALDHSIRNIREKLGDGEVALAIWVPYVHFGI